MASSIFSLPRKAKGLSVFFGVVVLLSVSIQTAPVIASGAWAASATNQSWEEVASSSDGTHLVAVAGGGGLIYTSSDSGVTWIPRSANKNWWAAASSSDGTHLLAGADDSTLYTSTDSGLTWQAAGNSPTATWQAVASSSDGTHLVAAAYKGQIYTSTDSGLTWIPRDTIRNWRGLASSSDGTHLAAVVWSGGLIYTSTDSGVTWTPRATNQNWVTVASSSDGTHLVAVALGGQIYTSADSGVTWVPHDSIRNWYGVASSSDGTHLVATVASGGQIYTSTDSGVTWTPNESARDWRGVASSNDGTHLVAGVHGGQIYLSSTNHAVVATPTPSPSKSEVGNSPTPIPSAPSSAPSATPTKAAPKTKSKRKTVPGQPPGTRIPLRYSIPPKVAALTFHINQKVPDGLSYCLPSTGGNGFGLCGGDLVKNQQQPYGGVKINGPYHFIVTTDYLPIGLVVHSNGALTGTVSDQNEARSFPFTICVSEIGVGPSPGNTDTVCRNTKIVITPAKFSLQVSKVGDGDVTSDLGAIDCGDVCKDAYDQGTQITLSATPDPGYIFAGWSGACSGLDDCVVTVTSDSTATATFNTDISGTYSGTVNSPNLDTPGLTGCEGGVGPYSITLQEDGGGKITGTTSGGGEISGSRVGNSIEVMSILERWGLRGPYIWQLDGGILTGTKAYFCYDLTTGALRNEGIESFTLNLL